MRIKFITCVLYPEGDTGEIIKGSVILSAALCRTQMVSLNHSKYISKGHWDIVVSVSYSTQSGTEVGGLKWKQNLRQCHKCWSFTLSESCESHSLYLNYSCNITWSASLLPRAAARLVIVLNSNKLAYVEDFIISPISPLIRNKKAKWLYFHVIPNVYITLSKSIVHNTSIYLLYAGGSEITFLLLFRGGGSDRKN